MAQERLIICNTSPMINLAEIGHLELLLSLPGIVCIPPAVVNELRGKPALFPKSAEAAASANGLPFTGTLGILAAAKARGEVEALAPLLVDLKSKARFWIHPQLERLLLQEAGEIE